MHNKIFQMKMIPLIALIFALTSVSTLALAQAPTVGRKAAAKYFEKDVEPSREVANDREIGSDVLMLHVGGYTSGMCYRCKGSGSHERAGKASYGVTYLYDQTGGLDTNVRFDFNEYKFDDERAT